MLETALDKTATACPEGMRYAEADTMTETEKLFLTLAVTLVGSGLGTTIVSALFKRRFDAQQTHEALLQRNSKKIPGDAPSVAAQG
jgi:hypothetical protein